MFPLFTDIIMHNIKMKILIIWQLWWVSVEYSNFTLLVKLVYWMISIPLHWWETNERVSWVTTLSRQGSLSSSRDGDYEHTGRLSKAFLYQKDVKLKGSFSNWCLNSSLPKIGTNKVSTSKSMHVFHIPLNMVSAIRKLETSSFHCVNTLL